MERLKAMMVLSLLSMAVLVEPQVNSLQIRPTACRNSIGDAGTCMFVWECIKTEGKHLGTCADGFLFGSCCSHSDNKNNLFPPIQADLVTTGSRTTIQAFPDSSEFVYEDDDKLQPTLKPLSFDPTGTNKPVPPTSSSSEPSHLQSRPTTATLIKRTTKKPLSHSTKPSLVTIENFLSRSTKPPAVVAPQKLPSTSGTVSPTAMSAQNNWFRPTGYTSIYAATNQPPHSQQTSTSSPHSQTTQKTTKAPYVRPSWRPRPPGGGYQSSSKPHGFTFSNYFTVPTTATSKPTQQPITTPKATTKTTPRPAIITRPTTKTTQRPVIITRSTTKTTQRPGMITKVTVKTTHRPVIITKTTVKTTQRPIIITKGTTVAIHNSSITSRPTIKTSTKMPATSTINRTTDKVMGFSYMTTVKSNLTWIPFLTTPRPIFPPGPISGTQFSWYPAPTSKTPISAWYNTTVINGNTFVESSMSFTTKLYPTIKPFVTEVKGTVFDSSSSGFSTASGTENKKSSTPSPIMPCGIPNPHPQKKVVGGKNSAFGSWPWQVSVRRTSFFGFSSTHRCGGALISRQWIATAGHCVDDLILSQIKIRVGEYDFASVQEPHGYVERGAKKKVVHPRYNFFTYENDLALVQLEEAIDSMKYPHISPICLPPNEESLVGRNATVTGWGRLSEGGILPSILQEVQVPIISNEKCKNMFLAAGRHEYIPDIFMCAGFEEGGRDSCQGDSGGPLQIQADEGYWFLAGIISWGIGCAEPNMPGVCTRISKFKEWVVQHVT